MIGNDIIDRSLCFGKNTWERKGFLNKLFSGEEQDRILKSEDPELTTWLLWAMKEATYKAHQRRLALPRGFNPKALSCELTGEKAALVSGKVTIGGQTYLTKASLSTAYIYAYATFHKGMKFVQKIHHAPAEIQLEFISAVSKQQNLPREKISIHKSAQFIPFLHLENQKLFCNFSLTHHGNFSAYIIELRN